MLTRPRFSAVLLSSLCISLAAAGLARAGGDAASCQKPLKRSFEAVAAYENQQTECLRAEIGLATKGKKVTLTRELDAGEYVFFCVGEMNGLNGMELTVRDKDGNRIKKDEGVDQTLVVFSVEEKQKGKVTCELNPTALGDNVMAAPYVIALMHKKHAEVYITSFILEKMLEQVKAIEKAGYVVEQGQFDKLSLATPWSVAKTLEKSSYWIEAIADEDRVKKCDVEVKDASGSAVAKNEESGPQVSVKLEAKNASEHKISVSGTYHEKFKEAFLGLVIAKKK